MNKKYDYAIFIGRFQPPHKAHIHIIEEALKIAEQVVIVLGSNRSAPNTRNPWTAVEREEMIDGQTIAVGDALVGIASSGPHSNGYSLIRKVLDRANDAQIDGRPAAEALLEPTRIYVKSILALMQKITIKGLSHILEQANRVPYHVQSQTGVQELQLGIVDVTNYLGYVEYMASYLGN